MDEAIEDQMGNPLGDLETEDSGEAVAVLRPLQGAGEYLVNPEQCHIAPPTRAAAPDEGASAFQAQFPPPRSCRRPGRTTP